MKEENWEKVYKEFDKKFNGLLAYYEVHTGETERENIKSFIRSHQSELEKAVREEIINELESNPNSDGSISPNIQHWIEKKQAQLRQKFLTPQ